MLGMVAAPLADAPLIQYRIGTCGSQRHLVAHLRPQPALVRLLDQQLALAHRAPGLRAGEPHPHGVGGKAHGPGDGVRRHPAVVSTVVGMRDEAQVTETLRRSGVDVPDQLWAALYEAIRPVLADAFLATRLAQEIHHIFYPLDPDRHLPGPNAYRGAGGRPGPAYWQQRADYKIRATLDEANRSIKGAETITYYNNSPDKLDYLWLQLDENEHSTVNNANYQTSNTMPRMATAAKSTPGATSAAGGRSPSLRRPAPASRVACRARAGEESAGPGTARARRQRGARARPWGAPPAARAGRRASSASPRRWP